jgi:parallel beta-helix repeat protein
MSNIRRALSYSLFAGMLVVAVLGTTPYQKVHSETAYSSFQQGAVCVASQMPGQDVGAKINACDARLGGAKGTIKLSGGGTIATPVVISSNHTLQVVSGVYRATNDGAVIRLKDDSSLVCDSWDAVLLESTGKADGGSVKPFTIVTAYNGSSPGSPNGSLTRNLVVKGCHFKGARQDFDSASQTVALGNCHNCSATNNWLEGTRTIGIQVGGGSALGNYADNVIISRNQLTTVASQNLAVVNSTNVQVIDNKIIAPGQAGGPGVVPIDVEPNVGDRIANVKISNNLVDATNTAIDASGSKGLHGIAINNANGASPFTGVEVTHNTVYGGNFNDPNNHISGALILLRSAQNTVVSNNTLRRSTYCILLDYGSSRNTIIGNQLSTCGSGSSEPVRILDSSNNEFVNNKLWADPSNFIDFSAVSTNIIERGTSNNNIFRGNDAHVILSGRQSRQQ